MTVVSPVRTLATVLAIGTLFGEGRRQQPGSDAVTGKRTPLFPVDILGNNTSIQITRLGGKVTFSGRHKGDRYTGTVKLVLERPDTVRVTRRAIVFLQNYGDYCVRFSPSQRQGEDHHAQVVSYPANRPFDPVRNIVKLGPEELRLSNGGGGESGDERRATAGFHLTLPFVGEPFHIHGIDDYDS